MKAAAFALLAVFRARCCEPRHDDGRHWKKHEKHHDDDDRFVDHHRDGCDIGPHDVRIISEHYAPRDHRLPPGLQKKLRGWTATWWCTTRKRR